MNEFKKSKTAKVVSGFVGLATALMMVGPSIASADATSDAQIAALQAQLAALTAQLATLTSATPAPVAVGNYTFTKSLKLGVTDTEVLNLQKVLNASTDTQVSAVGVGSKGNETKYFGAKTKAAVIKFQEKYASDILTPNGLTSGTGLVGASTRAKLNALSSGTTPTTPTTPSTGTTTAAAGLTVALAPNQVATTLISGQAIGSLGSFVISNTNATPVKVTGVKLNRTGISSDQTLVNVYLYNGTTRITDAAAISVGVINWTDSSGIVTIPAMGSVTVTVKADVYDPSNGQTVGVVVTEVTSDAVGATSGLPASGPTASIAAKPTGMTAADFTAAATLPAANANLDPGTDVLLWQKGLQINSRDAKLSTVQFRQIGSVLPGDIKNFRFYIDGVQVGTAVDTANASGYIVFDLASNPTLVKTGNHTLKVVADVVGGSTRTVRLSLRQAGDIVLWDSQLNVTVLPTTVGGSFAAVDGGEQTIQPGALLITKTTDSPSGNVVLQGSAVTLGKFTLKAQGERLKIESLKIGYSGTTTTAKLRNGALFANGSQVGSTSDIPVTGVVFNLGSALIVEPGKDVTLEVRADVYNSDTLTSQFVAGDTITAKVLAPASANVQRLVSLNYISNPTQDANSVTVATGNLSLAKYTSYANQTTVVPQSAYKVGDFRVTAGNSEGVNINTFTVTLPAATSSLMHNVYVKYGSKMTSAKANGSATLTWSVNEALAANATLEVALYADLDAAILSGSTIASTLQIDGTSANAGTSVTGGPVTGQTITTGSGTITVAVDASTPIAAVVAANSQPKVASFKFTTTNDAFKLTKLTATTTATGATVIKNLIWKDGATTVATIPVNVVTASQDGLSIAVPANTNKILDVYADLDQVGTPGSATTSANVVVNLIGYDYQNSNGVKTASGVVNYIGNDVYVVKSKPTVSLVTLPSTTLANGTKTIAKFSITADANGSVAWRKISLAISEAGVTFTNGKIYDAANESTPLANVATSTESTTALVFSATADQEVAAGTTKTYVVKADIASAIAGDSISASLVSSATTAVAPNTAAVITAGTTSFVWSDLSVSPHSATSADWMNDYLIKNLPTDSQTLSL